MAEVRDLNYYKVRAKELPEKKFNELVRKGRAEKEEFSVQVTIVATLLQQEARLQMEEKAKKITFVPPPHVEKYLFNELNFVLWSMPQENPIPSKIYDKMMKLKRRAEGLPIPPELKLTPEEKAVLVDSLSWKRGDEDFGVEILGSSRSGLPFGQDRLMLIWAITKAIQAGEPGVVGFHIKEFLDFFGIHPVGRAYDETQERCDRLQEASIRVWWTADNKKFELKCNYFDSVLIIRPRKKGAKEQSDISMISLNLSLWAHLAKENYVWLHPAVVLKLKDNPGALDLYQWACAYAFKNKMKSIPLTDLFTQLGMKEQQPFKSKKQSVKRWVKLVNDVINDEKLSGPGSHFNIELQEDARKQKSDLLIVHPSRDRLPSRLLKK